MYLISLLTRASLNCGLLFFALMTLSGCALHSSEPVSSKPLYTQGGYLIDAGHPVWFLNPGFDSQLGAVGIAKPQKKGGYAAQKRVALMIANAELARQSEIFVESELSRSETLRLSQNDEMFDTRYGSYSKLQAHGLTKNSVVKDEWLNRETGELYLWVVVEQQ